MNNKIKAGLGLLVGLAFLLLFSVREERIVSGQNQCKYVALTYDDGPNPIYTEDLLEVLEKEQVKASFFLMGKQVEAYPTVVKKIAQQGHLLGNHTYSHINVCETSLEQGLEEINRTSELIFENCGVKPEYFRPPFGCNRESLARKAGMFQVFWDVDPKDWEVQNTDSVVNHVLKHIEDDDIILMHDEYKTTVEATKILIPELKKMGYVFVTVDELMQP